MRTMYRNNGTMFGLYHNDMQIVRLIANDVMIREIVDTYPDEFSTNEVSREVELLYKLGVNLDGKITLRNRTVIIDQEYSFKLKNNLPELMELLG